MAASSVTNAGGSSAGQDSSGGLLNGTLDAGINSDGSSKRGKGESGDESSELHDNGNGNGLGSSSGNELDEEVKGESAVKRMRVSGGASASIQQANNLNSNAVSAAAVIAQNNAAYAAAAQSYHNALAAMNYTGVSLQTNKTPQATAQIQQSQHSFPGAAVLQQHPAFQQQNQQQHQQQQQQQLIQQYQAMAAAALASQGIGQGQQQQQQQAALGMNPNAGFQFAAMNPYLAALPQLAAAQRAQFFQQQQGGAMHGSPYGQGGLAAGLQAAGAPGSQAAFNPFGLAMQGGNANLQFQQNQQALLAAYGQFARGPVPVVSAAPTLNPQIYVTGNPAAAANGTLQAGVKRMRPA